MAEEECVNTFIVEIKGFGDPTKLYNSHALALSRTLNNSFGELASLFNMTGAKYSYDAFADDGHHPGHDVPLTTEEPHAV